MIAFFCAGTPFSKSVSVYKVYRETHRDMIGAGDLYSLPPDFLRAIRSVVAVDLPVQFEAPSRVSLFLYDNNTLIVENFRNTDLAVRLASDARFTKLPDLLTGDVLTGHAPAPASPSGLPAPARPNSRRPSQPVLTASSRWSSRRAGS